PGDRAHPDRRLYRVGYADGSQPDQRGRLRRLSLQADQPQGIPGNDKAGAGGAPGMSAPARILIVDDTPANLKLLGDLLGTRGYAISTAPNGEEGLAKILAEKPDLVLLDVMMPGISG